MGDDETKAAVIDAVQKYIESIARQAPGEVRFDYSVIVAALPGALGTKPGNRMPFDEVVVQAVGGVLELKTADLDAKIMEAKREYTYVSSEALGLWAIVDEAHASTEAAKSACKVAETALADVGNAHAQANANISTQKKTMTEGLAAQTLADEKVRQLEAAFAALERLAADAYVQGEVEMGTSCDAEMVDSSTAEGVDAKEVDQMVKAKAAEV